MTMCPADKPVCTRGPLSAETREGNVRRPAHGDGDDSGVSATSALPALLLLLTAAIAVLVR